MAPLSLARAGQHLHTAAAVTAAHGRAAGASGSVAELESAVAGDAEEARVAGARPKKEKAQGLERWARAREGGEAAAASRRPQGTDCANQAAASRAAPPDWSLHLYPPSHLCAALQLALRLSRPLTLRFVSAARLCGFCPSRATGRKAAAIRLLELKLSARLLRLDSPPPPP